MHCPCVFLKRDLLHVQVCTRVNYKTVPVTNFDKYLCYGTIETE